VQQINDLVKRPTDGAVVTFDGIVRNNFDGRAVRYLDYEAYIEMAERKMAEIGAEVRGKFPIGEIAIVHRLGRLEIGESSIVVAVAAPHRHAAFEACAYAMDRVKEEVPVWKKEFFCRWSQSLGQPEPIKQPQVATLCSSNS
jgi:molybdopterin synthase catalytic subunit